MFYDVLSPFRWPFAYIHLTLRNDVFCNYNIVTVECSVSIPAFAPSGLPFLIVCKSVDYESLITFLFIQSVG